MAKKATADTVREAEVLPAEAIEQETGLAPTQGVEAISFLTNLAKFVTGHRTNIMKASSRLAAAKLLKPPTTDEEDAAIEAFIVTARKDHKETGKFYGVKAIFHGLHKSIIGLEKLGADPYESAAAIAQTLHNDYKRARDRRLEEERRAKQAEEDRIAEVRRQQELAELEEQAIKLEDSLEELSDRERVFVQKCHELQNTERAVLAAGYKVAKDDKGLTDPAAVRAIGERLMARQKIKDAVWALREAATVRAQQAAQAQAPLESRRVAIPTRTVPKVGSDRVTKSAEIDPVDEMKLIAAVIAGTVPADVLMVNRPKLNEYARTMGVLINRWPGVRFVEDTTTR